MAMAAYEAHEVLGQLKQADVPDEQARAFARITSELATKADVEALRAAVKADRAADLAETKAVIRKWMLTTIALQTIVILGVLVALVRPLTALVAGAGLFK